MVKKAIFVSSFRFIFGENMNIIDYNTLKLLIPQGSSDICGLSAYAVVLSFANDGCLASLSMANAFNVL